MKINETSIFLRKNFTRVNMQGVGKSNYLNMFLKMKKKKVNFYDLFFGDKFTRVNMEGIWEK